MTKILTTADRFASEALAGFGDAYSSHVRAVPGGVLRARPATDKKVALVIGGGSGHYPAFIGFVGTGLADAAVAGDVFASPSTRQIVDIAQSASRGAGVTLGVGNYAGDVLNFGAAARQLTELGIPTRIISITDDIASAPAAEAWARRGIAGGLVVLKVAGAAAERGAPLDAVVDIALRCNSRTRTLGIAFSGCTLPGAHAPLFTVPQGKIGVGLGIHGEPGIDEVSLVGAEALSALLVVRLLQEAPQGGASRVAVVLNGLGATTYEELFVLWSHIVPRLRGAGLEIVAPVVGEFYTSLDMSGCSVTLTWLDDELESLWRAPADTPAFRRGSNEPTRTAWDDGADVCCAAIASHSSKGTDDAPTADVPPSSVRTSSAASRTSAAVAAAVLDAIHSHLRETEPILGQLDAWAGDGDHGRGMARGSAAARDAAADAVAAGTGVASTLVAAAEAWADRAGGTSGALWGLLLKAWAAAYTDESAADDTTTATGARKATEAVMAAGGARPGDKTMVDAMAPFSAELAAALDAGKPFLTAWRIAAERAGAAAAETAEYRPRFGRARPLADRSLGHPDRGAVSFAECVQVAGAVIAANCR